MAQITSPNPGFTGAGPHGVAFVDGRGQTHSEAAISYFVRKGYGVAADEFDTDSTKKAIDGKGPNTEAVRRGRASEDAAESATMTEAQRQDAYGVGVGAMLPPGHSITGAPAIDAGLPLLTYGQRQKLRDYLDERDEQDPNAQGPDAAKDGSADKAVKAVAKKTTGKKATRKSTRKSTKKNTGKSTSGKAGS